MSMHLQFLYHSQGFFCVHKGRTPLHNAVKSGEFEIVDILLKMEQIEVNAKDKNDLTPLHFAVQLKDTRIMSALCAHPSIEINAEDMNGRTPLHYAVKSGFHENVRLLLEREDVEVFPKNCSKGPIHEAADMGCVEIVKLVVNDPRVDVNATDGFKVCFVLTGLLFTTLRKRDMMRLYKCF